MSRLAIAHASIDVASVAIGAALVVTAAVIAWLLRRRPPATTAAPPPPLPRPPSRPPSVALARPRRRVTGAGLEVATVGMVCPTCRTEYAGMLYCQRDARRLVAADEMLTGRSTGGMCPRCGRAFEPGLRRCPHDGAELVPPSAYRATRPADPAPTGVLAKVCPVCRHRYDLSARFCGKDGHDLVVVN
ncbi:MAG: zinc ribbon domain-containing protein [Myxococcales bacterium]|nr:zinc ribbon domain-containing protein [Myxococcales bacterium]MBK7195735.1 zinc ribbon domain-containing protein [Myxococcales bacterium]MBP6848530.1 zinc ribbon domain-containing protein [Kofleriaceae bacterium]